MSTSVQMGAHSTYSVNKKKRKRPPLCSTELVTDSPGAGEHRPSCCLRNSPIPSSFSSVLPCSKVGLLYSQSPFLFQICCTFTKSLLLPVLPSSCLHCREVHPWLSYCLARSILLSLAQDLTQQTTLRAQMLFLSCIQHVWSMCCWLECWL